MIFWQKTLPLAIDIGCGQGQIIKELVHRFDKIIGFDISDAQIKQAQAQNTYDNVQYM